MKKDDNPKLNEDAWAVEPPKKGGGKAGKALRIALIAATLAAAATGVVWFGKKVHRAFMEMRPVPMGGAIGGDPVSAEAKIDCAQKENRLNEALTAQQAIHGGEFESGK